MTDNNKNKHLTLQERQLIQKGIVNNHSFKQIARDISKDCSTVSKEIRRNRTLKPPTAFYTRSLRCLNAKKCKVKNLCSYCHSRTPNCRNCDLVLCTEICSDFEEFHCENFNKPPYVCNTCKRFTHCGVEHYAYNAERAHEKYLRSLTDSRSGTNMTEEELQRIDSIVSPLMKNGQSPYHILQEHSDELMICEKTLYSLVNNGLLSARAIDLPRAVRRKPRKQKSVRLKVDKKCTIGRKYADFLAYMENHPDSLVVQGDSVEGRQGGKVILTLEWVSQKYQIGFLRDSNTAASVTSVFEQMYAYLGEEAFFTLFDVLLVDNGSEFSDPSKIEAIGEGKKHIHVFYAEPNRSDEKGACENNHSNFRRIVPKGYSMDQFEQNDISMCFSQINSMHRRSNGSLTAFQAFHLCFGDHAAILDKFAGIQEVDEINLTPHVLRKGILVRSSDKDTE